MTTEHSDILQQYMTGRLSQAKQTEMLMPVRPDCSTLLVACRPADYSASAMAKAVEDCDAQLLWLSVTGMHARDGRNIVALTVNTRTPGGVSRSLERYGYEVVYARGSEQDMERIEAMERVNELIHYLEI